MKNKIKIWANCLYKAGKYTIIHDGVEHAGYLAFLGFLSLFPFLIFFVTIAGAVGESSSSLEFLNFVMSKFPEDIIAAIKPRITEIVEGPPQGLLTIAIIGVIWTASSAVEGTRTILNRAYRVETPPAYVLRRMLSVLQFLILTAFLIVASVLIILVPALWNEVASFLGIMHMLDSLWSYISYAIAAFTILLVVAISYYILPNIRQRWKSVFPGAFVVSMLWMAVSYLFTLYLQTFKQFNFVYGSLAGIIIALLFFYFLAVVYIFGAEFNFFLEKAYGHSFKAKEKATIRPMRRKTDRPKKSR